MQAPSLEHSIVNESRDGAWFVMLAFLKGQTLRINDTNVPACRRIRFDADTDGSDRIVQESFHTDWQ
jgi:hypothetical protein